MVFENGAQPLDKGFLTSFRDDRHTSIVHEIPKKIAPRVVLVCEGHHKPQPESRVIIGILPHHRRYEELDPLCLGKSILDQHSFVVQGQLRLTLVQTNLEQLRPEIVDMNLKEE